VRVLVVEDAPKVGRLLKRGLEEEHLAVDLVTEGADAVWMATENDYDAIVLDVVLGDVDGFEVCRRLRHAGRWAPVLMLTARDDVEDRVRGLDVGADDYLTKPFDFTELLARLRALFRRGAAPRPVELTVGDLVLDPSTRRVQRGETALQLTATEFSLLEYFMRRAGCVLSRADLLEHVWDFAFDGDPHIVTVYVGYLRDKIDRPFARQSLETIRAVGYRLRDDRVPAPAD
jgi:two-component system, OmpR family, response regulator